ncbi:MAG TPA: cytochrome c oxidase assembly factor Coa1 family protein [Candidatus Tumulicola sp.]|jgi:hypothetical protein
MDSRVAWIVVGVVLAILLVTGMLVGLAVVLGLTLFRVLDRTPAHECGLAAVRRSPAAVSWLGTPIEQSGITGGSSSSANGELRERITFNVKGPRGKAFVVSEGYRSPLASHLVVRIGRNGYSQDAYSGPFDCPELHAR